MTWHFIEVWALLLVAFVAGCLLGTLLHMVLAASPFAETQRAAAEAIGDGLAAAGRLFRWREAPSYPMQRDPPAYVAPVVLPPPDRAEADVHAAGSADGAAWTEEAAHAVVEEALAAELPAPEAWPEDDDETPAQAADWPAEGAPSAVEAEPAPETEPAEPDLPAVPDGPGAGEVLRPPAPVASAGGDAAAPPVPAEAGFRVPEESPPATPDPAAETGAEPPPPAPEPADEAPPAVAEAAAEEPAPPPVPPPLPPRPVREPRPALPAMRPLTLPGPRNGVPDNLQRIRGIGQKNEGLLNELGIYHFGQIAAWTPAEARWVGAHLAFPDRVERDDWIGQAIILATGGDTGHVKGAARRKGGDGDGTAAA